MRLKNKVKLFSAIIFMLVIVVSSSMVFAADPNTWTTKAPMNTARYGHETVVLDGQIYVIGGSASSVTLNSVEQYDPVTNKWTTKAPMANARAAHQVAVVNDKIYAIGGSGSQVEEYNPATDTWTTKASMAKGRTYFATAVVNGKIYAIGGSSLKSVEEYDPANNIWITKSPMSTERMNFKVAVVNGKIYAIGGKNTKELNSVEEYDPATDTWTTKAPMKYSRRYYELSVLNGEIYVLGGTGDEYASQSSVEKYNPSTNTWTSKASLPVAGAGRVATLNGKIYVIAGGTTTTANLVEEYDPTTDKWTKDAPMVTGRFNHQAVAVNGKIYAIGGMPSGAATNSVEEYTPTSTGDNGNENPPVITGNSAILEITMVNGVIKEYDLNAAELDSFLTWYDKSSNGSAPAYYTIIKKNNIKPFLSRKEYIAYSKIASFEIKEYAG